MSPGPLVCREPGEIPRQSAPFICLPTERAQLFISPPASQLKEQDKDGSGSGGGGGSPWAAEAAPPGLLESHPACSSKHLLLRVAGGDARDRSSELLFQRRTEGESVLTQGTHLRARPHAHAHTERGTVRKAVLG